MNQAVLNDLIDKILARRVTFPELLVSLAKEEIESYHVDFLRDEFRFYSTSGKSLVTAVPLVHDVVAPEFFAEKLQDINRRVQAGQAWYPDFVKEGAAAGCAYYIVYLGGKKVRYFGRDGDEYIQYFPGSR